LAAVVGWLAAVVLLPLLPQPPSMAMMIGPNRTALGLFTPILPYLSRVLSAD
jgi:hypothetical protein